MTGPSATSVPSRDRYTTLDGLRGIAALFVVVRHYGDLRGGGETQFSYLAVDLFFLLSGFVLSFAYSDRFAQGMTVREFMVRRVVRLYPLYLPGVLIGLELLAASYTSRGVPMSVLAAGAGTGLLMLPAPTFGYSTAVMPALLPAWSLFLEVYVANSWFALARFRTRALVLVVMFSALLLTTAAFLFGTLDMGAVWPTFAGGFPRVCFSFFAGVLIQRLHRLRPPHLKIPSWIVWAGFVACLMPTLQGLAAQIYGLLCILVLFPALVYWGAEAKETHPWLGARLGDISYATYVIHYPLLEALDGRLRERHVYPGRAIEAGFVLTVIFVAWLLDRYYDRPFRIWLSRRLSLPGRTGRGA